MRPRLVARGLAAGGLATVVLAAGVLAAGCLSVPLYEPEPLIKYTDDDTGTLVASTSFASTDFALHFAGGGGFHFPDALTIKGTEVMGHNKAASCSDPDEAGFQFLPTQRISGHSNATIGENRLVPVLRGPAIVQVMLEWAPQFSSSCTMRTPAGTSTFTVFPDGRIVRHDTLQDADQAPINAKNCACNGGMEFKLAPYWMFATTSFQELATPATNEPQSLASITTPTINNYDHGCLNNGTYQVAFAWHNPNDMTGAQTNGTVINIDLSAALIGVSREQPLSPPDVMPPQVTLSELDKLSVDDHSAIFIGLDDCATERARAKKYIMPPTLKINDAPPMVPALSNGIYGGDVGSDGQPGLELMTDHAELKGLMNERFAVWLRFPHAVDTIRATHPGSKGAWYVPQRVDDRSWIVWVQDPPKDLEPIMIEPN